MISGHRKRHQPSLLSQVPNAPSSVYSQQKHGLIVKETYCEWTRFVHF